MQCFAKFFHQPLTDTVNKMNTLEMKRCHLRCKKHLWSQSSILCKIEQTLHYERFCVIVGSDAEDSVRKTRKKWHLWYRLKEFSFPECHSVFQNHCYSNIIKHCLNYYRCNNYMDSKICFCVNTWAWRHKHSHLISLITQGST